jgi:hypothetical protein
MESTTMPPHLKNWVNVPPGSTMHVKVSGDVPVRGDPQREVNNVVIDDGDVSDTVLRQGWRAAVRSKETVSLIVFLTFAENGTKSGNLEARVVKPDGSVHGSSFNKQFSGKAGDSEVFAFISARGA